MSVILGINAFHAGASAAILIDGKPVIGIAEERLNRVKYYAGFPALAIKECLKQAGLNHQGCSTRSTRPRCISESCKKGLLCTQESK